MKDSRYLRHVREELGFTQAEMGQCLKVSTVTISAWEKGRSSINHSTILWLDSVRTCLLIVRQLTPRELKFPVYYMIDNQMTLQYLKAPEIIKEYGVDRMFFIIFNLLQRQVVIENY
jgi:transcriptional regulator with XRE-family HTH domain